jgi:hypothetical protein
LDPFACSARWLAARQVTDTLHQPEMVAQSEISEQLEKSQLQLAQGPKVRGQQIPEGLKLHFTAKANECRSQIFAQDLETAGFSLRARLLGRSQTGPDGIS